MFTDIITPLDGHAAVDYSTVGTFIYGQIIPITVGRFDYTHCTT